jgi:hypothetical protein
VREDKDLYIGRMVLNIVVFVEKEANVEESLGDLE